MLDLTRTEEQMLAEIACEGSPPDAPWCVTGRTPYDLLPVLRKAFFTRYAHLPRAHVSADLVALVKHGLGNAYKRGNERDSHKLLTVTTTMTDIGAVIKVTDQGHGFDARRVVEKFARQERYFVHAGAGFTNFQKTTSIVSFADGGRTLLIRFLVREERGNGSTAKRAKTRWIDFAHLRLHDQVKVKGAMNSDGSVTAITVSLKQAEDVAVIQAPLKHVDHARVIHLLNSQFILSDRTEIASTHSGQLDVEALRAGQVVELTGRCSFEAGFSPVTLQIRNESSPQIAVLRGRIEEINPVARTFRVLGITIATDDETELIDKR